MKLKLFIIALLAQCVSLTAMAYDAEIDGIYYEFSGTEACVVRGDNLYSGDIVIPQSINYNGSPYTVTSIGEWAFGDCVDLTSIILPNSVTTIGRVAFNGCRALSSINFSDDLINIGEGAFGGCENITSITIPKSVTSIGDAAFEGCSSLTAIVVQEGNAVYDSRNECNAIIESATNTLVKGCNTSCIPEGIICIGDRAFLDSNLRSIVIPKSVTTIGERVFELCVFLESIVVADGNPKYDSRNNCNAIIETASNTLLYGCNNSIIPEDVIAIGNNAFDGFYHMTSITIPDNVTSIGYSAFSRCSALTSINFPEGLVSIGSNAFSGCDKLESISIPESVNTIGFYAFTGTKWYEYQPEGMIYLGSFVLGYKGNIPENTKVAIKDGTKNIADGAFIYRSDLTSITIPKSIISIGESAFANCSGLTSITIPNSVTHIGVCAFGGCSGLTTVKVGWPTPLNITSNPFSPSNSTLYVPRGSKTAYQTADIWKEFQNFTEYNYVDVENYSIVAGSSAIIEIGLNNDDTDIVAFQMDLTLPEGVGLDKDGCTLTSRITDEEQIMTIGKLENGGYRLTSSSLSLKPISGTEGPLLILKLTAAKDCANGQATISNIRFSTSESERIDMVDETFRIAALHKLFYKVDDELYQIDSLEYKTPLAFVEGTPLITDVEQFSSPMSDPSEGDFSALLDPSNAYTFWHSSWHGGETNPGTHFFQVEMIDPEDLPARIKFEFTRRQVQNDHTTEWRVMGTNDYYASKSQCEELAYIKTPFTKMGETITSESFNPKHYKYLRFYSEVQVGEFYGNRGYFHLARFQLYPATITPKKEGYTFDHWEGMPETMPKNDVEVTAAFTINTYTLTYIVDGEEWENYNVEYNSVPPYEDGPAQTGYTFGWDNLPEKMPAYDVEVTGRFYLYGDVNTDEEVDVVDVVDIARFVVATPSGKFREKLADLNKDNSVNLGDAVVLVNHIAGDVNFVKAMAAPNEMIEHGDALSLTKTGKTLALNLTNRRAYTAFQFDLYVDDEANVTRMALNAQRKQEHQLFYNKVENGHYRVAVLSTSNRTFNGNEGELLSFIMDAEPSADTEIRNIRFFDTKGNAYAFDAIGIGLETGLKVMQDAASKAQGVIYDLQGRRLTKVQRGVNIVNGKKFLQK